MNHFTLYRAALAAAFVMSAVTTGVHAQSPNTAQVLHGGTRCDHVIALIHRHGVNNSFDHCDADSIVRHRQFGSMVIPGSELGDLQIMQVKAVASDDPACGPEFVIVVHNASTRAVCHFHVSAVAVLGRIFPDSPNATVQVAEIKAGEALEVCVQLPIEALAMGNRKGQAIGFQKLIVAIDSYDELVETNEANNIKAFHRSEIPVAAVVSEVSEVGGAVDAASQEFAEPVDAGASAAVTQAGDVGSAGQGRAPAQGEVASKPVDELRQAMQTLGAANPDEADTAAAL